VPHSATFLSTVQRLLQTAAQKLNDPSLDPKGIDGKIARVAANSNTVAAIRRFKPARRSK